MKRLFIFILISFLAMNLPGRATAQCLSGTYNIGSGSSEFNSFQSAVDTLEKYGICGPVVLMVSPDTYTEKITISTIGGVSDINTIRFVNAGTLASDAVLTYPTSALSTENYTLQLNAVDFISFENFTITRSGNNIYGNVIDIRNGSDNVTFSGNVISSDKFDSPQVNLIYSPNTIDNYLTITNNIFRRGDYAVNISGTSIIYEEGLAIEGNTYTDQSLGAVKISFCSGIMLSKNTFNTTKIIATYEACNLNNLQGTLLLTDNKLGNITAFAGYGFKLSDCYLTSGLIANNMINMSGYSLNYPLYVNSCNNLSILFNSIRNKLCPGGVYISGGSNLRFNNNIVHSLYAVIHLVTPNSLVECNYNNLFYTSFSSFAIYNSTFCKDFIDWRTKSGKDLLSISVDSKFLSSTDLHVDQNDEINERASYSALVPRDIDGEIRDLSKPDIGADEFILRENDISFFAFVNPDKTICSGTEPIKIAVKNRGSNSITSFDIHLTIDNVALPPFNWTGNLTQGSYDTVIIASALFVAEKEYYLRAWVANPNGVTDTNKNNDSSVVNKIYTRMQGVYTIGGSNPSYATFTAAADALRIRGVCGPVTFNVRTGTYMETFTVPDVKGTSSANKIVFQSETGVNTTVRLLVPTEQESCIQLRGAKHIVFQKMTLSASAGNAYANAVYLNFNCVDIGFYDNIITGNYADAVATSGFNDSLYFTNNYFNGGATGLNLGWSHALIASNSFVSHRVNGVVFTSGIYVVIDHNTFNSSSGSYVAIKGGFYDTTYITSNTIMLNNTMFAIEFGATKYIHISNNFIKVTGYTSTAIHSYASGVKKILYNTIWLNTTSNSNVVFLNSCTSGSEIKNNIFYNSAGGNAIYCYGIYECEYNNLYTTGPKLINDTYTSIAMWEAYRGQTTHSISSLPLFLSSTDLHSALNSPVGGKGVHVSSVYTDADGESRKQIPDIGADEFYNLNYDAGIITTNKPSSSCRGIPDFRVKIKNFATDTLRYLTIGWSVNNIVQPPFSWNGKIAGGDTSQWIQVGIYQFPYASTSVIKCWTSILSDVNHFNDTLITGPFNERMGGVYTIGKQNSDFTTISDAATAVNYMGVCQPVVFKIKDGVYEENVTIYAVPGSSGINTVKFESESGDSSKVILVANSISPTLKISGASNLIFSRISVVQNYIYYNPISIGLSNNCHHILFENNYVVKTIKSLVSNDHHLSFSKNYIFSGGINLTASGTKMKGNAIVKNSFRSTEEDAIIMGFQDSLEIRENVLLPDIVAATLGPTISSDSNYITGTIITISDSGPYVNVYNNKLNALYNCFCYPILTAIKLNNCTGTPLNPIMVYNNFISVAETYISYASIIGIENVNSSYVNYFHNSISLNVETGTDSGASCFLMRSGSNIRLENNQLVSYKQGFAIYSYVDISAFKTCDYNNLYIVHTGGSQHYAGEWNGKRYKLFSDWQTTGFDKHSLNIDPEFLAVFPGNKNYADLHLNTNVPFTMTVPNYLGITNDIDGEIRSTLAPVIGADEYSRPAYNAQALRFNSMTVTPCSGNNNIVLEIANYGSSTLSSVTINWTIDGLSQTPYYWTGSLVPQDTALVTIAQYTLVKDVPIIIQAWTIDPNGYQDAFPMFDSTEKTRIIPAMNGVYTIGGVTPDYPTFTDAVNALKDLGVCGSVLFNVRPGIYSEQIRIPFIKGSSAINTITFQSENNDSTSVNLTRSYSNTQSTTEHNYIVYLDGVDYISFKKMTMSAVLGTFCRIVFIANESNHIEFSGNFIQSSISDFGSGYFSYNDVIHVGADYQESSSNNFILFSHNRIEGGAAAISVEGMSPGDYGNYSSGIVISDNTFEGQSGYCLSIVRTNSPLIIRNKFNGSDYSPLYLEQNQGPMLVMNNIVNMSAGATYIWNVFVISNHFSSSESEAAVIANNVVNIKQGNYSASVINSEANRNVKILFNTINLDHSLSASYSSPILSSDQDSALVVMNNIFSNLSGGYITSINAEKALQMDYNLFYTTGSELIQYNGEIYDNLRAYSAVFNNEKHSIVSNPLFIDNLNDLHLASTSPAIGKGIVRTEVLVDAEDKLRTVLPSIGAYEEDVTIHSDIAVMDFCAFENSAMCAGLKPLSIVLKNFGLDTLKSATVNWSVNNISESEINWQGVVEPGGFDTLNLGAYLFTPGDYILSVVLSTPNSLQDEYIYNDTLTLGLSNIEDVPYADFSIVMLSNNFVLFENSSVGATSYVWNFGDANTSTDESPYHAYDGGDYTVILNVVNDCGTSTVEKDISIIPTSVKQEGAQEVVLFPNPSSGIVNISWKGVLLTDLTVTSALGQIIYNTSIQQATTDFKLRLEKLPSGLYSIELKSENKTYRYSIVIAK